MIECVQVPAQRHNAVYDARIDDRDNIVGAWFDEEKAAGDFVMKRKVESRK